MSNSRWLILWWWRAIRDDLHSQSLHTHYSDLIGVIA